MKESQIKNKINFNRSLEIIWNLNAIFKTFSSLNRNIKIINKLVANNQ